MWSRRLLRFGLLGGTSALALTVLLTILLTISGDPADPSPHWGWDAGYSLLGILSTASIASLLLGAILYPLDWIITARRRAAEKSHEDEELSSLVDRVESFESEHEDLRRQLSPTSEQLHHLINDGQDLISDLRSWDPIWFEDSRTWAQKMVREINRTLDHLQVVRASDGTGNGNSEDLRALSALRAEGLIDEEEFAAFTARFRSSEKMRVREILDGIEQLQRLHSSGGLSQGNYADAIWGLLDKLDRRT